tara:strand:- start:276 stop:389 length:114 start_codon:yes stop_codon:yes gene_type:complete
MTSMAEMLDQLMVRPTGRHGTGLRDATMENRQFSFPP